MIAELSERKPEIAKGVFVAETADIIGDVKIGANSSIWYRAVLRGDVMPIEIGDECNIQDGVIIHGTYKKAGAKLGRRVSVGHGVLLHGCEIGEGTLVGMGAIIMDKAKIPAKCLVGAGSLVTEGSEFEEGDLIIGRPAKTKRKLTDEELAFLEKSADNYLFYKTWYEEK